jgi:AcrR family transcriptional regulator
MAEAPAPAKVDRRVRRTRELLRNALYSLVLERGYERITVQDIIDRADVGRSTFYAHFHDKEELLLSGFEEVRDAFTAEHGPASQHESWTAAVFDHVSRSAQLYLAMVGKQGAEIAKRYFHELLTDLVRAHLQERTDTPEPRIPIDVIAEFAASTLVGLSVWWIENGLRYSPHEIDDIYRRLTEPGIRAGLRPNS